MKTEILFLAGMCLCACSRTPQEQTSFSSVKVVHAEVMEAPSSRCYTFISQPYRLSELSFRVGGPVHAFDVQQGQFFRKGQLIAAIDERDFVIQKQRTEALYRQAEVDYARISSLYAKDNISGMNYEQAKANYERTKADYEAAVNAWEDSRLYAPFDGYVQQAHIERYQDVKPSVPVVTFIDLSRIKVEAYVPEDMALQMRKKDSVACVVRFNALPDREFVRRPRPDELKGELFSGRAYDLFRQALRWTIQRRYVVLGAMVLLLVIAGWGFRFIPQQFMPLLNKQYFSVDVWLPEGTRIEESDRQMTEMTAYLNSLEGVKKVSSFVGQTPPRYYLANAAYGPQPNYAQCLVEADTPEKSRELQAILYDRLPEMFPDALVRVNSFEINSIPQTLIEARFCGDDPEVLDSLTNLALIMLLVILVMLFGNFRQPLIIFLILPLSLIGMVFGLWVTGFQFGFFCIAGWLGLLGMIIKNVIVLLDEVNIQQKAGVEPYTAVIEATVSRARPVLMAALTTVFGLSFATLLTLFVTPALYTVFYKISKRGE